ncbi:DoxX family protein [Paraburkholderia bryophila]|uniref:DoxX family protein n=1 Tax=Paraburkholderia bryophila TaxID=420952 RepID=UPI00234A370F|nr:DoxX family protein [Paraburkholderia bryophila]WCM23032.1 DoxX family protein [Paraburkholderia bryophila]
MNSRTHVSPPAQATQSGQAAQLFARLLMSLLFLISGVRKLLTWSVTIAYFNKLGVPFAEFVVPLTILLEIGGGLALIAGWRLRDIAAVMALYTFATAFIAHRFWQADAAQFNGQLNNFFKNIAMVGGFLLLVMMPVARKRGD